MGARKNGAREGDTRGERELPLPLRVSLEGTVLSCTHYFQAAPATQANIMKICNFYLFSMLHHLDARMRTAAIRTGWRNGKMTFFFFGDMF